MDPLPPGFRWPDGIRAAAMFTFDVDAEALSSVDVVSNPVLVNRSTAPVGTAECIRSVTAELRAVPGLGRSSHGRKRATSPNNHERLPRSRGRLEP